MDVLLEPSKMLDISNCCRVCMKSEVNLLSLFDQVMVEQEVLLMSEALMHCTGLKISQEDGLPQNICHDCAKTLETMYSFRIRALFSEAEFKKLITSMPHIVKDEVIKSEMKLEDDDDIDNMDLLLEDLSVYPPLNMPKEESDSNKYCENFDDLTEKQDFSCDKCSKKYTKKQYFLKHLKSHESPMYCDICNEMFYCKKRLNTHIKNHSSGLKCYFCGQKFECEALLFDHIVTHTVEANIKCPNCDIIFSTRQSFVMHLRSVHGVSKVSKKKVECDICKTEFVTKSLLNRHMKLHRGERPFQCKKCTKSYCRQDQLLHHMKFHDGIKPYICSFCSKAFNQMCSLKDHMRIHTGETPFLCSECGKSFSNSSNLRQHVMRHSGVKPYKCNLCPKSFTTKGQMTAHMTTHTGVHPYKCEQCGSTFTKANSLKKHNLIHLGVKPFACETCKTRFTCKEHLKRHCRIHTGEKPYRCAHCDRAFTQSNDLAKHIRTHIGQNIYQCTVCSMRFRLKSELKHHYPTHYVNGDDIPKIPISKGVEVPILILKPQEETTMIQPIQDTVKHMDPRVTITINSNGLDKNGVAGDITINIMPEKC